MPILYHRFRDFRHPLFHLLYIHTCLSLIPLPAPSISQSPNYVTYGHLQTLYFWGNFILNLCLARSSTKICLKLRVSFQPNRKDWKCMPAPFRDKTSKVSCWPLINKYSFYTQPWKKQPLNIQLFLLTFIEKVTVFWHSFY